MRIWKQLLPSRLPRREPEQRFIVLSFGWNCERYLRRHVESVREQRYDNFVHVVVDDGSSDDTYQEMVRNRHPRMVIHRNPQNLGWLNSAVLHVDQHIESEDDIILQADLDDRLGHRDVFSFLDGLFRRGDYWLVHGGRGWPADVVHARSFRTHDRWAGPFHHPRAFRAFLWNAIDKEDFRGPDGTYARSAQDRALYYPILEMTPSDRQCPTTKRLYAYNRKHSIRKSGDERIVRRQLENEEWFRSKKPYPLLSRQPG
jgi:glycosyltransferase involved in cell wall biosynthesis